MSKWIKTLNRKWGATKRSLGKLFRPVWKFLGGLLSFKEKEGTAYAASTKNSIAPPIFSVKYPWYLTKQFFLFLVRFIESRSIVPLIQGTPAATALFGAGAVLLFAPGDQAQLGTVISRMRAFQDEKQFESSEWYARKATLLDPANENLRYSHAIILENLERTDECRSVMANLADSSQYIPAIEWLCQKEFERIRSSAFSDTSSDALILHWLGIILDQQPRKVEANFLLGSLHLLRGMHTSAIGPLEIVIAERPQFAKGLIALASAYDGSGQGALAQRFAGRAGDAFQVERMARPSDELLLQQTIQALTLGAREAEAIVLIDEFLRLDPSKAKQLRWLQGDVYVAWTRRRLKEDPDSGQAIADAAELIFRGLNVAPQNPRVVEQLGIVVCDSEIADDALEAKLQIALDAGASPAMIHFILGTRQLLQNRTAEAERHFSISQQQHKSMPGLLNNLAEVMMLAEDPNVEQALTLVNQAIALMPNQPHFFDTRGKIYLRQQQYLKAIADFERVLVQEELRVDAHLRLAEAYSAIGDDSSEKRHRILANTPVERNHPSK